ncbi:MAG: hypothetical protein ACR2O4_00605, partial [Hyphomicrobiaceae bacterium]
AEEKSSKISLADLGRGTLEHTRGALQLASSNSVPAAPAAAAKPVKKERPTKLIGVTRAVERTEQEVFQEQTTAVQ